MLHCFYLIFSVHTFQKPLSVVSMCFNILNNCKCYTYIIDFFSKVSILDSILIITLTMHEHLYFSPLPC